MDSDIMNIRSLQPHCAQCFGLCCVALYFSSNDGFPTDKAAGTPCPNLRADYRCAVHDKLGATGLRGCIAYECFGAGQKVSQLTFAGEGWRQKMASSEQMFAAFLVMRQLHELCWYLYEALTYPISANLMQEIRDVLISTKSVTEYDTATLLQFDLDNHFQKVDLLLRCVSGEVRRAVKTKNAKDRADYFGRDLRKKNLRSRSLRSACLIAANLEGADLYHTDLIGADMRGTNIRGADLSGSVFLTQPQVNSANGNAKTKLPALLDRPKHWEV